MLVEQVNFHLPDQGGGVALKALQVSRRPAKEAKQKIATDLVATCA